MHFVDIFIVHLFFWLCVPVCRRPAHLGPYASLVDIFQLFNDRFGGLFILFFFSFRVPFFFV